MKIKNLKIHNILSIEDAEVEFGNSGLVLIEGLNTEKEVGFSETDKT